MMTNDLKALLGETGYISFDELVNVIHKYIGLDNTIEQAEQLLLHILDKYIDTANYGHDGFNLYNKISEVWQPIAVNPYDDYANLVVFSPSYNDNLERQNFYNIYEILTEILKQRHLERMPFPF